MKSVKEYTAESTLNSQLLPRSDQKNQFPGDPLLCSEFSQTAGSPLYKTIFKCSRKALIASS